jgi:malonyl CoA-acyl carrier protein transacylase
MAAQGVELIAECGPGKVLAGLNKRIVEVPTQAITELLLPHPGLGELRLLAPVLAGVADAAELYGPTARPVAKRRQLLTGPNPMRRAAA